MSNSYQYVLQVNPYLLKWSGEIDPTRSFDTRICGQDDCLGNFWNIGISLESLSSVEQVSIQGCDHPFFRKYWQTKKKPVNENDAIALGEICEKILPFPEKVEDDHFPEHAVYLAKTIENASGYTPVEDYDIHLFCSDAESGQFLIRAIQDDPKKKQLLSVLKIRLCLESDPVYLKSVDGQTPKPAVVPVVQKPEELSLLKASAFFRNHLCFRLPKTAGTQDESVIFVNGRSQDSPSFWIPKSLEELAELVWQHIDFYFLRWRYLGLWDYYLSRLHWKNYVEAAQFIKLGIMNPVAVLDERAYSSSVVVNHKIQLRWHKETPVLTLPGCNVDATDLNASCTGHQTSASTLVDGGTVEIPTGLNDIGNVLSVHFELTKGRAESDSKLFIVQRDGTVVRKSAYDYPVKVEDDGNAAGIEIVCKGTRQMRNGRWCFPSGEDIELTYGVKSHRNGSWSPQTDPVSFRVNGMPAENPYLIPKKGDIFEVKAETKSGKTDAVTMYKLPRANAILQNFAQVFSGNYASSASHERTNLGLSPKSSQGKRINSVRCAQNTQFVLETRGVFQKDPSAEVWNDQCESILYNSKNEPVPVGDWKTQKDSSSIIVQIKRPGNYTLLTKSADVPDVDFPISFSVFANHSKVAFGILSATFILSLIVTLSWFGLNLLTSLLYLACPLTLLFILTHKEGCIQNKRHSIFFYLIILGYVIIICKVLFEELQ